MSPVAELGAEHAALLAEAEVVGQAIAELAEAGDDETAARILADLGSDVAAAIRRIDAYLAIRGQALAGVRHLAEHYAARAKAIAAHVEQAIGLAQRLVEAHARAAGVDLDAAPDKGLLAATRIEAGTVTVGLRRNPDAIEVTVPANALPPDLQRVSVEPDKKAIKAAIKAGRDVPGIRRRLGDLRLDAPWGGVR